MESVLAAVTLISFFMPNLRVMVLLSCGQSRIRLLTALIGRVDRAFIWRRGGHTGVCARRWPAQFGQSLPALRHSLKHLGRNTVDVRPTSLSFDDSNVCGHGAIRRKLLQPRE